MIFLLFSGPPDSGKTTSIKKYAEYLNLRQGYSIIHPKIYTIPMTTKADVHCVLEKNGKQILIHSETDQVASVDNLCNYYEQHPNIIAIITASRDEGDYMRTYLFDQLKIKNPSNDHLEIPLGRMVRGMRRGTAFSWYLNSIFEISKRIGLLFPFNFYKTL